MFFLDRIQHFYSDLSLSTVLLLSLISIAVLVEAQETTIIEHWPVQDHGPIDGGLRIEDNVDDRHLKATSDGRNEEGYESTGSGFVANALAAGLGTLLANGITNYGSYGYPYASGAGLNNMAGTYVPGSYATGSGAYVPNSGAYVPNAGGYIPGAGVHAPGSYIPGAGPYIPGSYIPGAGAYVPSYGVISTGYRPPPSFPIYGDQDDSNVPDSTSDLADFANSYPGYYSELLGGNTPLKKQSESNVAATVLPVDVDPSVAGQPSIRIAESSVRFPIEWSAMGHDYFRSISVGPSS